MARTKGKAKSEQMGRADVIPTKRPEIYTAEYAGYLVCDITVGHEKALETETPSHDQLFIWMSEMVDSGFKVIITYSKDGASVRAELHDMDSTSDFAGWRLSSFADNMYDAIVVLRFKQQTILSDDWSLAATSREKRRYG